MNKSLLNWICSTQNYQISSISIIERLKSLTFLCIFYKPFRIVDNNILFRSNFFYNYLKLNKFFYCCQGIEVLFWMGECLVLIWRILDYKRLLSRKTILLLYVEWFILLADTLWVIFDSEKWFEKWKRIKKIIA